MSKTHDEATDSDAPPSHWPSLGLASELDTARSSEGCQDKTSSTSHQPSTNTSPQGGWGKPLTVNKDQDGTSTNSIYSRAATAIVENDSGDRWRSGGWGKPLIFNGDSKNNDGKRSETVSLAIAADVAQAQFTDNTQSHALGKAVAQQLQFIMRNPSNDDELNDTTKTAGGSAAKGSKTNTPSKEEDGGGQKLAEEIDIDEDSSSIFKRLLHAIDNYMHPPSKLISSSQHVHFSTNRHHHQGHRLNSMHSSAHTSAHPSNHACNVSCLPNCAQQQQAAHDKAHGHHSSRKRPSMKSVSSAFSSKFHTHSHKTTDQASSQPKESKPEQPTKSKSFFPIPFPFHSGSKSIDSSKRRSPKFFGPLLYNCSDHEEHEAVVSTAVHVYNLYHLGHDVTRYQISQHASGGDVSVVAIGDESENNNLDGSEDVGGETSEKDNAKHGEDDLGDTHGETQHDCDRRARHALSSLGFEFRLDLCQKCRVDNDPPQDTIGKDDNGGDSIVCPECATRLYHVPSNTAVNKDNRRTYIADGKMYESVANLCQASAQEIMAEKCDLMWVTICDGKGGGLRAQFKEQHHPPSKPKTISIEEWPRDEHGNIIVQEPIRALVGRHRHGMDANHPRDTFLVATGKGKVRAGIFSRHHLMTTGLEQSTALPLLREARKRGMNCVVVDPNARGDRCGMDTFEVSVRSLFEQQSCLKEVEDEDDTKDRPANVNGSIYVLAHSAAGGQLVRYLLDQQRDAPLLSRIRCITFTDSTHSVQWLKKHPHISTMIQSSKTLYVRSANPMRDDNYENASPGDECPHDPFWKHRFGDVKTVWAGTTEHSLSNWTAHKPIWDHFDKVRGDSQGTIEPSEKRHESKIDANGPDEITNNEKSAAVIGTKPVVI